MTRIYDPNRTWDVNETTGGDARPVVNVGQKLNYRTVNAVVSGIPFAFERRRYNGKRTFTWVHVWNGTEWLPYGDPWPSVTVPKRDLESLAACIHARQLPIISDARNRA